MQRSRAFVELFIVMLLTRMMRPMRPVLVDKVLCDAVPNAGLHVCREWSDIRQYVLMLHKEREMGK